MFPWYTFWVCLDGHVYSVQQVLQDSVIAFCVISSRALVTLRESQNHFQQNLDAFYNSLQKLHAQSDTRPRYHLITSLSKQATGKVGTLYRN